ncbi:MAG: divalent-cation tolerance protein CutA [Balneolaceae bacterium]|nr:divalent-cation tolerance protein CutA [Balneolaceae bacterium]MBO6545786.1 divalent-cation tolerance protein CutA [Balneolaceae bacterium]MBO6647182.1 divalent-cation tolerance protein CutA [Balneolaceae bacterium]
MYYNLRYIYITTSNKKEAKKIGLDLVENHLVACVNIIDGMESIYRWQGKVEEAKECVLIAKTHYSKVQKLTERVKELHSYDCPCVVSMTITEDEGNKDYLDWLTTESKAELSM